VQGRFCLADFNRVSKPLVKPDMNWGSWLVDAAICAFVVEL